MLQNADTNLPPYRQFTKLDWMYDGTTIIIHTIDVLTDYLVAYQYYQDDHPIYVFVSLSILLLVMLINSAAFATSFVDPLSSSCCKLLTVLFLFLPISPLFSLICWLDHIGILNPFFAFIKLRTYPSNPPKRSNYRFSHLYYFAWLTDKFESHIGFVFSLLIETFPFVILQMIYIVTFRKPTAINIISIIASVLSVITKSMMFCYARDFKVFMLNLLCFTADIFGIFAVLSWVFDRETTADYPNANLFNSLALLWRCKVLCITLPCAVWLTLYILFNRETPVEGLQRLYESVSSCLCLAPISFLLGCLAMSMLLMFVFGVMSMVLEIIFFAMLPWFSHSKNQPHKSLSPYFNYVFEWIQESYPYPVSFAFYLRYCPKCKRRSKTEIFVQTLTNLSQHNVDDTVTYLALQNETELKVKQQDVGVYEQMEMMEYKYAEQEICAESKVAVDVMDDIKHAKFLEIDWKFRIFITIFLNFKIFLKNMEVSHNNPELIPDSAQYIVRFFKTRLGLSDDKNFKGILEFFKHSSYSFDLRKLHNIVMDKQLMTTFKKQVLDELGIMIPMPFNRFLGNGIFQIGYIQNDATRTVTFTCKIWEFIGFKILLPLFILSKLMNFIYPFLFLMIYFLNLSQIENAAIYSTNFHSFQLTFTLIFVGLVFCGIMGLFPFAYRYYITLWHLSAINVNRRVLAKYFSDPQQIESIVNNTKYLYYEMYIMMISTQLIKDKFGWNIGDLINEYVFTPKIILEQIMYAQDWDEHILNFEPMDIYNTIQPYLMSQ